MLITAEILLASVVFLGRNLEFRAAPTLCVTLSLPPVTIIYNCTVIAFQRR